MAIEMLCIHTQCLYSRVIVIRCVELCTAIKKKPWGGKSLPYQKALHRNTVCHAKKKALTTVVMLCSLHRADGRDRPSES